jgi:hypothetical protein
MGLIGIDSGTGAKQDRVLAKERAGEHVKILQVSGVSEAGGSVRIEASLDGQYFEVCEFANGEEMIINRDMELELPVGNYEIRAEYVGVSVVPEGIKVTFK